MLLFRFITYLAISVCSAFTFAQGYINHQITEQGVVINTELQSLVISAKSANAVEVLYKTDKNFPSFALDENRNTPKINIQVLNAKDLLVMQLPALKVELDKSELALSFYQGDKRLTRHKIQPQFSKALNMSFDLAPNEILMGAGERVLGMDRRGHRLPLYNRAHYGYTTYSEQMNYSLPAVMSNKPYVLLFDNSAKGWLDLGKTNKDTLMFESVGGRAAFLVIAADTYPDLIASYVDLTGRQPMPARWFLGNHASRFGYRSQKEVLETISLYRSLNIAVDSVILDLYWFGKDVQGHMGNLTWDETAFPEPEKMIKTLSEMGVKTTLITEPFVLKNAKRYQEAKEAGALAFDLSGNTIKHYDFFFGHTALIDVFSDQGQQWFGSIYEELASQGVTGVWGDLGEPEVHPEDMLHVLSDSEITATADAVHNVYGHQWAKLVFNQLTSFSPNERPFILMRSGFAGSQRYGLIPWTGDVSRSWGGLKPQVELSLQMSLLGLAYTHSDLGGFAGDEYDKEMYIRWLQYGTFQPIYRPHAQEKVPSEPVFHDKETQDIVRKFIELRYQLLPYNYTLAYSNSLTGMPLMRPMFFADESNPELIKINDQFMWGDSFVVKPITDPKINHTNVWLPKGNWFDFWTGEKYSGEQNVNVKVDLKTIPVLVKAGAIIPTVDAIQTTENYSSDKLNINFYFDSTVSHSESTMYEDDGKSRDALQQNAFELLTFKTNYLSNKKRLELSFEKQSNEGYQGMPETRYITAVVHNWQSELQEVKLGDTVVDIISDHEKINNSQQGAYFNAEKQQLIIKFVWQASKAKLLIK